MIHIRHIFQLLGLLLIATGLMSCGGNRANDAATYSLDTLTATVDSTLVDFRDWSDSMALPVDLTAMQLPDSTDTELSDSAKYAEGIIPQMLEDNPQYARRLLESTYPYFIVVDKPSMHVVLFDRYGRKVHAYKMACGKNYGTKHEKRDCRTPEGFFEAGDVYDSTEWLYTDDDGVTSPKRGQFGPRFIRVKNPVSGQIGIHGTCSPWALGSRASHGCIRIHNDNILELVKYVTPGMPIIVNPSRRDQAVNLGENTKVGKIYIGQVKESRKPIVPIVPKVEEEPKPDTTAVDTVVTQSMPAATDTATVIEITPDMIDRRF